jgi:hypothetical protein
MRTLEELRTEAKNVPFTGSMDYAAFGAFEDVRGVLLGIIEHLGELERRQGDTDHGKLSGTEFHNPLRLEDASPHGSPSRADPDPSLLARGADEIERRLGWRRPRSGPTPAS